MFYTLYKITNNINGKIYIGCHKTDNLDDGYFGSGKYLKRSINKYGIENFTKEIMYICRSAEEMFDMESLLVTDGFIKRDDTYNIKEGGFGGFDHINKYGLNVTDVVRRGTSLGKKHSEETIKKLSGENNYMFRRPREECPGYGNEYWLGKRHTEESKQKIGDANSKHQSGQGNVNYGRCWIYCPYTHESKPIPRYELKEWEDRGWVKGRKIHKK